jgi:F-type H+-transporting ATPase subunit gamma
MPSLKVIRKRISSVKNTQKITRAMKLVSAAKLRRAQDAIVAARPYVRSLERVVAELSEKAGRDSHPLLKEREGKKASILMLTSDRGQAGAFNANIIRRVQSFTAAELADYTDVSLRIVGRKGNDYFKRREVAITSYDPAPTSLSALGFSHDMSNRVAEDFLSERADRVYLVFNEFKSAMSQGVVVKQLLPIDPPRPQGPAGEDGDEAFGGDYLYEPSKEELLEHLMPLYIQIGIYNAALESIASEFGARMTAMENATRNAGEMISKLTLQYNRARQAAITKELLEIISGAEALKG